MIEIVSSVSSRKKKNIQRPSAIQDTWDLEDCKQNEYNKPWEEAVDDCWSRRSASSSVGLARPLAAAARGVLCCVSRQSSSAKTTLIWNLNPM